MSADFTPRQRMLNAYRGIKSDRSPVAPEFWCYYPARVLGVDMIEFQRELFFWQSLQYVFQKYSTEGWGPVFPVERSEDIKVSTEFKKIDDSRYREKTRREWKGSVFESSVIYDLKEPCRVETYPADGNGNLPACIDMFLSGNRHFDFAEVNKALETVGEE